MIKLTIKFILFTTVVLLIGQIRVGNSTLANRFQHHVFNALQWGRDHVEDKDFLAEISNSSFFSKLLKRKWFNDSDAKAPKQKKLKQSSLMPISPETISLAQAPFVGTDRKEMMELLHQ